MRSLTEHVHVNSAGHSRHRWVTRLPRLACVVVGLVLIDAAWGKVVSPGATERVLSVAGLPPPAPQAVTAVLPGLEAALGLALLFGWSSRLLAGSAVMLFTAFTGFLAFLARSRYGAIAAAQVL